MSDCRPCLIVRQLACNTILMLDLTGNAMLGGNPRETISKRTARARANGSKAAKIFCGILSSVWRLMGDSRDHCTWALNDPGPSIGGEIWHWSQADTSAKGN
jgi:hypothetical protein